MYIDGPLRGYLDDLAAKKPAPGGGSAAALCAASGVALMSMVANYTVGNPKYKAAEAGLADLLVRAEKARQELEDLIDRDVEAYQKLSKAMKEKDPQALQDAYKEASRPPYEVCRISAESLRLCKKLAKDGNPNLITDTAMAAILLEAAFFSAKFNVYINLKYIKEMKYIEDLHKVLAPLEKELPALKEEVLEMCEDVIAR